MDQTLFEPPQIDFIAPEHPVEQLESATRVRLVRVARQPQELPAVSMEYAKPFTPHHVLQIVGVMDDEVMRREAILFDVEE